MFWLTKFFSKGKSVKDAIKYFHTINGRPPSGIETIRIKNAFMEQTRGANVIQFPKDRITDPFKPRPGDVKKTDESPLSTLLERQGKELEGIDTKQGLGFYREMGDIMKKHRREELELAYDEMFNKILEKAKRIDRDPLPLLEAELGKKLTGKETTTQLLDLFKNRPKKASGGRIGMFVGGPVVKGGKWFIKNLRQAYDELIAGKSFNHLQEWEKEGLKWEILAQIKKIERGEPIPKDMLKHMRKDKRFKDIMKTRSTDPELYDVEEVLLGGQKRDDYLEALDKKILKQEEGYLTQKDLDNMSSTALDDLRRNADPIGMQKHFDEITPGRGVGDFADEKQTEILEQFDVTGRKKNASGGIAGLHMNRPGYASGEEVYGPPKKEKKKDKKKKKKKKEEEEEEKMIQRFDPFWQYGLRFPTEEKPGKTVDPSEGIDFSSFGNIDVDLTDPRFQFGLFDPIEEYHPWEFEIGKGDIGLQWKKKFGGPRKLNQGGIAGQLHMNQGGRTSSGLNYLLGEDDQNVRVPFKLGGIDKGRRAFMKWIAGLTGAGIAAGTGLLKWGKVAGKGKTVIKAGDHIIQGTPGMPDWYIPLVNRIVREGDDVTKALGTIEREIVHSKKISAGEEVTVYRNMDTGNVRVEYGPSRTDATGKSTYVNQDEVVHLEYRAGEVIDEGKHAGKKTDPEFSASETEPEVVNWDGDIEWSGVNEVNKVDDLVTDTSKLKEFGQKKLTHRDKVIAKKKKKYQQKLQTDQGEQIEYVEKKRGPFPDPSDYSLDADEMAEVIEKYSGKASGGRVSLSSGGLAGLLGE